MEQFAEDVPRYAILSHMWDRDEVILDEMKTWRPIEDKDPKAGFRKIQFLCSRALRDTLRYAWIDTACIDKSSSAELTEAINSMRRWYMNATKCYVYMADVPAGFSLTNICNDQDLTEIEAEEVM